MMQAQGVNWAQWVILIVLVIGVLGMLFWLPNQMPAPEDVPTAEEIAAAIPPAVTAEEIAALIDVPTLRNNNFDDILEGVYPDEVKDLEEDCQEDQDHHQDFEAFLEFSHRF